MKEIPESELILNPDGSVYHLHLLPEDIAGTVMLVGDPDRVGEVSKHFDRIEIRKQKREFVTHTGYIGAKRLSVVSTGIGTDNIDIVLNELDMLVNIDLGSRSVKEKQVALKLVRIGTSGALQRDIPVDSFLVSSHGLGLDNLMNFYSIQETSEERQLKQEIGRQLDLPFVKPYVVAAPGTLAGHFKPAVQGITATCCGFYGPQGRVVRAAVHVPDLIQRLHRFSHPPHRITNFEMETAGIYGLARLLGHEALSVNAVIANRVSHEFSADPAKVVEKTIRVVLETLANMPT